MLKLLSILFVLVLAGCESFQSDQHKMISRPFSAVDATDTIVLDVGRNFDIALPSNPSTGFSWKVNISDPAIIHEVTNQHTPDRSNRIGVAGQTVWTFKTLGVGSSAIVFSYSRPWEENKSPTKVVTFSVQVQ